MTIWAKEQCEDGQERYHFFLDERCLDDDH